MLKNLLYFAISGIFITECYLTPLEDVKEEFSTYFQTKGSAFCYETAIKGKDFLETFVADLKKQNIQGEAMHANIKNITSYVEFMDMYEKECANLKPSDITVFDESYRMGLFKRFLALMEYNIEPAGKTNEEFSQLQTALDKNNFEGFKQEMLASYMTFLNGWLELLDKYFLLQKNPEPDFLDFYMQIKEQSDAWEKFKIFAKMMQTVQTY